MPGLLMPRADSHWAQAALPSTHWGFRIIYLTTFSFFPVLSPICFIFPGAVRLPRSKIWGLPRWAGITNVEVPCFLLKVI